MGGRCLPIRHTRPALSKHLLAPGPTEDIKEDDSEEDEEEGDGDMYRGEIHQNLMIRNLVRQNALIRSDDISQC